jgi:hypothetical protein
LAFWVLPFLSGQCVTINMMILMARHKEYSIQDMMTGPQMTTHLRVDHDFVLPRHNGAGGEFFQRVISRPRPWKISRRPANQRHLKGHGRPLTTPEHECRCTCGWVGTQNGQWCRMRQIPDAVVKPTIQLVALLLDKGAHP